MHPSSRIMAFVLTIVTLSQAQNPTHLDSQFKRLKIQNGQFITWEHNSQDRSANQVKIYTSQGRLLTQLSLLRLVPEAKQVTIYDVAMGPSGSATIAAVFGTESNELPSSTLLYFDPRGHLTSAITLHPTRTISRLAVDDNSNVWTLTLTAAHKDASQVPMLVEYDPTGHELRGLLKRTEFPADAAENRDDLGFSGFGYENGTLWFWLPASQDLVTVDVSKGSVAKAHTGMPKASESETAIGIFRDPNGLVAQIRESAAPNLPGTWELFRWSAATQAWSRIQPVGCEHEIHAFVGLENGKAFFADHARDGGVNICASEF